MYGQTSLVVHYASCAPAGRHVLQLTLQHLRCRKDLDANQPYRRLELRTCATRVRFHPSEPGMLAVGMVTGEWSLLIRVEESVDCEGDVVGMNSRIPKCLVCL